MVTLEIGGSLRDKGTIEKKRKLSRMPPNNFCINYSSYQLSPAQQSLLNKHLSFVPIPNRLNKTQVEYDLSRFKKYSTLVHCFNLFVPSQKIRLVECS